MIHVNKRNCKFLQTETLPRHTNTNEGVSLSHYLSHQNRLATQRGVLSNSWCSKNNISSISSCCNDAVIQCKETSHMTSVWPWTALLQITPLQAAQYGDHISLYLCLSLLIHDCVGMWLCVNTFSKEGSEEDPLPAVSTVVYVCRHRAHRGAEETHRVSISFPVLC